MPQVVVVTVPDLAPGYRLAGARTLVAASAEEAAAHLRRLCADPDAGIVALHEPFHRALGEPLARRAAAARPPIVVALPAGERGADGGAARARLTELLRRAIGWRMSFGAGTT